MTDAQQVKRWKAVEAILARACKSLPSPAEATRANFEAAVADYHHYLEHNELEMALDALAEAAELVAARGGVWRDLERAAHLLRLNQRAADLHRKFVRAMAESRG